jgi:hypothetical protein
MRELRFVSAQPATIYYAWQVEVLLNNFMEMGVNLNNIDIICWKQNNVIPDFWSKLANRYAARFFFYDDTRQTKHYISSIRPNLLKQHWLAHPYLKDQAIFYHDSDIIFTKPVVSWITAEMLEDEKWYGSDTRWYISHKYIKEKGQEVIDMMCNIMELPEKLIEDNELNAIGAQYLMKNITSDFWDRVEKDSERLFNEVTQLNSKIISIEKAKWLQRKAKWEELNRDAMARGIKFNEPEYNPLQIWCADMWAVLWGAWRLGYKTNCHSNFEFSWGTSNIQDYNRMNIMHNAGVINTEGGLFYKSAYMNETPYNKNLKINENTGSREYYRWIEKTEQKSCLL